MNESMTNQVGEHEPWKAMEKARYVERNQQLIPRTISEGEMLENPNTPESVDSNRCRRRPRRRSSLALRNSRKSSGDISLEAVKSLQTDGTLEELDAKERSATENQWKQKQGFWQRLAITVSPHDVSPKELVKRATFMIISFSTVGVAAFWCVVYASLGKWVAACLPLLYSVIMGTVLATCIYCANEQYEIIVQCQLTLILMLPFAMHLALGGIEQSGGIMMWSFLSPFGAAFFRSATESIAWFKTCILVSILLVFNEFVSGTEETNVATRIFYSMNILGVMSVMFAAVLLFARDLEKEFSRSEEVLLNVLPFPIMKRIKQGELPIVDNYAGVSILFADLVGFTKASAELHPNFLIGLFLRDVFDSFDKLVTAYGLEKIKTIGDAYMVVGGLKGIPSKSKTHHTISTMFLAKRMFVELDKINRKYGLNFSLRVGIHTGPAVAGVLGLNRFSFDVWGDSVNTASRMESNGTPGQIHISSEMYRAVGGLQDHFEFSCCGKISVKGKGEMVTYLAKPVEDTR